MTGSKIIGVSHTENNILQLITSLLISDT